MKSIRKVLLLCSACLITGVAGAQEAAGGSIHRGYKGFVSAGIGVGAGHYVRNLIMESTAYPSVEVCTTQGVQLSAHWFIGAGTGITYGHSFEADKGYYAMPVYAAARYTPIDGPVTMVLGARIGKSFGFGKELNPDGIYVSPSAGVRIAMQGSLALNITLDYVFQRQNMNTIYTYYRTTPYEFISLHSLQARISLEY